MSDLRQHVTKRVAQLAPTAKRLLLAVSGGADSVAMVRLLQDSDYQFEVAHLDHALRPASASDAAFVTSLCADAGIVCHRERMNVAEVASTRGWNLEEAARRLRYSFLTRIAKRTGADVVVTAHTQNDQVETVLMQLLRGSAFLRGMPARQRNVIRPLLGLPRSVLLDYLADQKQPFREDESNADTSRTRAWLRHEVMPLLGTRYPSYEHTLARLSEIQATQEKHFDELGNRFIKEGRVAITGLQKQDTAVQRHVIASLLGQSADFVHIEAVRERLGSVQPVRLSLPQGRIARLAYGKLEVVTSASKPLKPERFDVALHGSCLGSEVDLTRLMAFPDLCWRSRAPGDTVQLAAGTKKLSDLLIDKKVSREDRASLPVIASGKQVLWVQDVAVDRRVALETQLEEAAFMRLALAQAAKASNLGELPVGAVIVKNGAVIAEAHNETEALRDPTAHAETLAIRRAAVATGDWRLTDCTLYVTLEPCPMCFGAILQAVVPRVVYAAANFREGALGSVAALQTEPWKWLPAIEQGPFKKASETLLSAFFAQRR